MTAPEAPSQPAATTPLRALVEGAAWLLGLATVNHLVETVIAQNLLASMVATAVIADLGASRAGVSWADPSDHDETRAAIGRRVLRAAAVALVAALVALLAGLVLGLAQVDVAAPAWTTLLALLRAIAIAVRAELLLRGVVFHFAARAGLREPWSLGFAALASGALLAFAPFATAPAVALAIAGGALFGAVWSRLGGAWAAVAAHATWAFMLSSVLRGAGLDVRWSAGTLAEGVRASGAPAWLGAAVLAACAAAVLAQFPSPPAPRPPAPSAPSTP
jgi:membrane protease YdiL (CAAX protease family)